MMKDNSNSLIKDAQEKYKEKWFFILGCYFIIEYARIQEIIPIGYLRPGFLVIIALIAYFGFYEQKEKIFQKQINFIIIFIIISAVFVPLARNSYYAFHSFQALVITLPALFGIVACIDSISRLNKLMLLLALICSYISIYSFFHSGYGPGGIIGDANDVALFIVFSIPFLIFIYSQQSKISGKIFFLILLLVAVGSVAYSNSRGGFVGLAAVIFVYFMFSKHRFKLSIVLLISLSIFVLVASPTYLEEIRNITDTEDRTAYSRVLSWKDSWKMFLDNPLGVGPGNFSIYFEEYQSEGHLRSSMWGRAAHSLWFTLLPEMGMVGSFIYFLIIYSNFKGLRMLACENNTYFRNLHVALLAAFVGFFASATFLSVLYYPHFWVLTAITVSAVSIKNKTKIA